MSLFFEAVGQAKRAKGIRQQRNAESLQKIGCAACPLNKAKVKSPKMGPTLAKETQILFIGEAPGGVEDSENKPFVGPSGQLLRECIPSEFKKYSSFDNVINCRPPDNRTPVWSEIQACHPRRVKVIEECKPKLIVGLGATVLHWMLNSTDMAGLRGRIFVVKIGNHTCHFLPTYHPSFILRTAFNKNKPLTSKFGHCLKMDIKKACDAVATLETPAIPTEAEIRSKILTFNGNDFDQLLELLSKAKKSPVKAVDIETSTLRPYAKNALILSCAISFNSTNISFAIDHSKAKWTVAQRNQILKLLKEILLDDTTKVAHHVSFELEWFIHYFGKEIVNHCAWECTQLQAHFLDERRGAGQSTDEDSKRNAYQKLDFLFKMHFGIAYKQHFKLDKKNMANSDLAETLVYGGADTYATLRLWHKQTALLRTSGLYNAYTVALPRAPVIALIQYLGMPISQVKVKEFQGRLSDQISVIEAEIESLDVVKQYIKEKGSFNPVGNDAITLFRDYLKRKEIQVQDGKRTRWSVDKHVLEKIDHPLAQLIVTLRNKSKMKSTYVDGFELGKGESIWPDGKIHCNFNSTFTTTGRLSSDQPNMQNFPHRSDAWIREQVEAPEDHYIIAADFSQLEMCGAAICSKDRALVKVLWDDYDTHFEWASKLAKLCPQRVQGDFEDPKIAKGFRSIVKNLLVFPAIFGSQNSSIARDLKVDESIIDELMSEFWGTFKDLKKWQDSLMNKYYETGYVEAPTGRRRHYPLTRNEAINAPIQCVSSEIVCEGMNKLSYIAATEGKWWLHPRLNIHDDLTTLIPSKNVDEGIETMYKTMVKPDFDCVNVPLAVSISVGKNWHSLTDVGKFWSHRNL